MSGVTALIFDLDGTLVDSLGDIAQALNATLTLHALPTHGHAAYRKMVGEGVTNLVKRALPPERQDLLDAVLADYKVRYAAAMLDQTRPYDGVQELLLALLRRHLRLGVLSNKPDLPTSKIVQHFFPHTFHAVAGERLGYERKPDPRGALELCAQLGARPETCAFIGDSKIDMQTAAAAGMRSIGVTWGFRDEAELRDHGAGIIIHRPAELLRHLAD